MTPTFAARACTALLMLSLAGCTASTKLVNSWKEPDTAPLSLKQGDLVIAMVMSKEETTRRTGEDLLGEELRQRGLRPIPSFTLIPTDQVDDKEKAAAAIQDSGAVALVAMRPIAVSALPRRLSMKSRKKPGANTLRITPAGAKWRCP